MSKSIGYGLAALGAAIGSAYMTTNGNEGVQMIGMALMMGGAFAVWHIGDLRDKS